MTLSAVVAMSLLGIAAASAGIAVFARRDISGA
jgi:hypothetical protein